MSEEYKLKEWEQFNQHQEDSRNRTDTIAKSVFLISGASLSLSASLFLSDQAPELSEENRLFLKICWGCLFFAVAGYLSILSLMVCRAYVMGEQWRKRMNGDDVDLRDSPGIYDTFMWILGPLSFLAFLVGMFFLAYVSMQVI